MRIVSLLPSATEIVCALGLADQLVGLSHSCRVPARLAGLPRLTSTCVPFGADSATIDRAVRQRLESSTALYDLDLVALANVRPELVISQALCDVCAVSTDAVLEALAGLPIPPELVDLTPHRLADVLQDIQRVANAAGVPAVGADLAASLQARIERVAERSAAIAPDRRPRVLFLEWLLPPFNGGHWNPELVALAGGVNLLGEPGEPSRTRDWDELAALQPDVLIVACCGLTPERAQQDIAKLAALPAWRALQRNGACRLLLMDGYTHCSSPGPGLVDALEIIAHALHPQHHPAARRGALKEVFNG